MAVNICVYHGAQCTLWLCPPRAHSFYPRARAFLASPTLMIMARKLWLEIGLVTTLPGYWPLIGPDWSRDLNTGLWLAEEWGLVTTPPPGALKNWQKLRLMNIPGTTPESLSSSWDRLSAWANIYGRMCVVTGRGGVEWRATNVMREDDPRPEEHTYNHMSLIMPYSIRTLF